MRICFFIWGLHAAGAERVLSFLANEWTKKGWKITILTMEERQSIPFYPLADSIELKPLDLLKEGGSFFSGCMNNFKRILAIRRALRQSRPDVLISFIDKANALAVLASRGLDLPVIISERTDPSRRSLGLFWGYIRDFTYRRADFIVFQSKGVLDWFPPKVRARGVVIPNPISPPPPMQDASYADGTKLVISMGRLAPIKGVDVLIRAFATAVSQTSDWRLEIWGQGEERDSLERLAQQLAVSDRIRFRGITDSPFDVLRGADLFVMSSHAEGFPNALMEAMACGLPVISTRFGGAVEDIIQDGVDGLLVPPNNPDALARALTRLMADPEARARLGGQASKVVERFSAGRVLAMWEGLLQRISSLKRSQPGEGRIV